MLLKLRDSWALAWCQSSAHVVYVMNATCSAFCPALSRIYASSMVIGIQKKNMFSMKHAYSVDTITAKSSYSPSNMNHYAAMLIDVLIDVRLCRGDSFMMLDVQF